MNQCDRILHHLQHRGRLTSAMAMSEYGIHRLAARVYDLNKGGWDIQSRMVKGFNRYGEPVTWKEYWL